MSSIPDAAGADEGKRKERTPKGYISCGYIAWA